YFFGLAVVAVALAFLLADQLFWEPGVSASNVRRIRPGMTLEEVKAILGGPYVGYEWGQKVRKYIDKILLQQKAETEERWRKFDDRRQSLALFAAVIAKAEEGWRRRKAVNESLGWPPDFEFKWEWPRVREREWKNGRGTAIVGFDWDDRAVYARFEPAPQKGP